MAYGGGTFTSQNKTLPGAYINFVSTSSSTVNLFGSRGTVAVALPAAISKTLEWKFEDFKKNCKSVFGYDWNVADGTTISHRSIVALREIFCNASKVVIAGLFGTRQITGTVETELFTIETADINLFNLQFIVNVSKIHDGSYRFELLAPGYKGSNIGYLASYTGESTHTKVQTFSDFIAHVSEQEWCTSIEEKNGSEHLQNINNFSEGSHYYNWTKEISEDNPTYKEHEECLELLSKKSFNILICDTYFDDADINTCSTTVDGTTTTNYLKDLYHEFTRKQREELGVKFQTVYYDFLNTQGGSGEAVNSEYAISVKNDKDSIFWVGGALAGASFNESLCNKTYDGELTFDADISAEELKEAIEEGSFIFHTVGDEVRVMDDINTYVEDTTETKNKAVDIFNDNQSIRIIDQIGNDVATIFIDNFLGKVSATPEGRAAFWSSIVDYHEQMQNLGGITNFTSGNIQVLEGEARNSVIVNEVITLASSMKKLYMQVTVQ